MADESVDTVPKNWNDFIEQHPAFPEMMAKWLTLMERLFEVTPVNEIGDLGWLILSFMKASVSDLNDILTLSHANSQSGAQKILRSVYERTVTMKYLAENPAEVEKFISYQRIDWQQILLECEVKLRKRLEEPFRTRWEQAAADARKEFKGEPCEICGLRKQISWTPKSVKELAGLTGLEHMHFQGFLEPSKIMHPTYWGTMQVLRKGPPLYNVLNTAHELLVHIVLIHRRFFATNRQPTPMMIAVTEDYLKIWVFAETSFGGLLINVRPQG